MDGVSAESSPGRVKNIRKEPIRAAATLSGHLEPFTADILSLPLCGAVLDPVGGGSGTTGGGNMACTISCLRLDTSCWADKA
jgi:hypothetical protein